MYYTYTIRNEFGIQGPKQFAAWFMACTMRLNDGPNDYGQNVAKKRRNNKKPNTTQPKSKKYYEKT